MKPLLLIADLAYETEALMQGLIPGTGDAETLRSSYSKVRALKEQVPDLVILASHDPGAFEALGAATRDTASMFVAHRALASQFSPLRAPATSVFRTGQRDCSRLGCSCVPCSNRLKAFNRLWLSVKTGTKRVSAVNRTFVAGQRLCRE